MRIFLTRSFKEFALLTLAIILLLGSCTKEESNEVLADGEANVKINILGSGFESGILASNNIKSSKVASLTPNQNNAEIVEGADASSEVQTETIQFSDELNLIATLTPADLPINELVNKGRSKQMSVNGSEINAEVVQQPLAQGVRYRVSIYDSIGNYVDGANFYYGQQPGFLSFKLDAGKVYTFVGHSMNATTNPDVFNRERISTATLNNVTGDLMYFIKTLRLNEGDNRLDVVLKHQFSQITTRIQLSASTQGNLTAINSTFIRPTRTSATFALGSGALTYNTVSTNGTAVTFPSLGSGVRTLTSNPTLLISPATENGQLNIGSITIGGTTRGNIAFNNLKITPGRRYNLNLSFESPCLVDVTVDDAFNFNVPEGSTTIPPTKTIIAPAADFGFVFDVTRLDNSFNLTINGTPLISNPSNSSREVQFQTNNATYPRNIRFADGTIWGAGGIDQIYNMNGTQANPVIRVVITATGDVFMYGSKTSGGPLFPLELTGGWVFNTVTWNSTTDNEVVVSQAIQGPTIMTGSGSGKRVVPCP